MKNRKEVPTQYPDVFRILVLDKKSGKWVEPKFGRKYKARRYVKGMDGRPKRIKRSFESVAEAKAFRNGTSGEKEVEKVKSSKDRMTLGTLADFWKRDWLPNKDVLTQMRYKSYLQHFLPEFSDEIF